ncbi:GNAT family N-acetyltransferase [Yoonia vestfoldensis]|uniref:GNAT family N-acetyltransferase n=1 Tax=Yoonia vestfoldensis TaxID=245188 RepID=UPI00037422D9|nr:GNAT family N-acetyltransferase [Yoonia vestfoldensis]
MQITHTVTETKGSYSYRSDDQSPEARMTYSRAGDKMIIIDHTEVPDVYRGQNVGLALVARAVADARENGWSIVPLCPFAAAQFRRHRDWADVLDGPARPR